ncbi:MAG TPA: GH116 family glycosyl hydrolase, partial [Chthonomonadaceae bacterium]|nr:GH116 family glycosyl hydrolase [Chthonomonadaceae bacterium]
LKAVPGVEATEFEGEYPIARIRYEDKALPVQVSLEAYSPFCPLDAEASGVPAIVFRFTARNPADRPARVSFTAFLQNFVGWDGVREIRGAECAQYGGNTNSALNLRGMAGLLMQNGALPALHPKNGSLCLAALQPEGGNVAVTAHADIGGRESFWRDAMERDVLPGAPAAGPSPSGRTIDGAVSAAVDVPAGDSRSVTLLLCWHFPNRYVDYAQWFSRIDDKKSQFWIGNAYAARFAGAAAVAEHVRDEFERLDSVTHAFQDAFFDSTLPPVLLDCVSSQMSIVRTPTCFWDEHGRFFGFEGSNGASTGGWDGTGGCCPMNCTHVWTYEMSLAALFPGLERSMRDTELFDQLHASGYLPHRVTLPLYLPRPWEHPIGGPEKPALDGLLSMVLKSYREHKRSADPDWLARAWPKIKLAMRHVMTEHDTDADGVLKGEQPNTYDISVFGPNTFVGTLYLAALRAAEEMARIHGEPKLAAEYRVRFQKGSAGYDSQLWNGEYFIQVYDPEKNPEQNYGQGCHSDQLLGQWWASVMALGAVLPEEHVRSAISAIVRHNLRENFVGHKQVPRQFASDDEPGLLVCSWPRGGRPAVPTLYSDEVWTGIEYEVAALCLYADMPDEAIKILSAVRKRYNGARRSPWNDIECGDHYVRAMSSWALLDAACGYDLDTAAGTLTIAPRVAADDFRAFFITATAWGSASISVTGGERTVRLAPAWGELKLKTVAVGQPDERRPGGRQAPDIGGLGEGLAVSVNAVVAGQVVECSVQIEGDTFRIDFAEPVAVPAGESITINFI